MIYTPHDYQRRASQFVIDNDKCALWLEMGLGKTAAVLAALKELFFTGEAKRALIVAPLRVAVRTWPDEIKKWADFHGLTYTVIRGEGWVRLQKAAKATDIHLINYENIAWLVEHLRAKWPYDTLVLDESSRAKSHSSERFKALRKVSIITNRVIELTGTPSPNGLLDIWAPMYLLDRGERLGTSVTAFKTRWFKSNAYSFAEPKPLDHAQREIEERVRDIVVSMRSADYLQLPEYVRNIVDVDLPDKAMREYRQLEDKMFLEILKGADTHTVTAFNAAAVTNKCLQYASGAMYLQDPITGEPLKDWAPVHAAKLEALDEVLEEAAGAPVLCVYWFQSDLARLTKRYPHARVMGKAGKEIDEWNAGRIPLLLINPGSAGHGLNLQAGGNIIVWFSQQWSLELYQQTNARLYRQGQTKPVYVHHLVARGTLDEEVLRRLDGKASIQDLLLERLKARRMAA